MNTGKIYFISRPSPTLGRSPLSRGAIFGLYREKRYISALQHQLATQGLAWSIEADDTESDIEKLIAKGADLLICAPGLRLQLYTDGFDQNNIIHLNMMDYVNNNTRLVMNKIKEYDGQRRTFQ